MIYNEREEYICLKKERLKRTDKSVEECEYFEMYSNINLKNLLLSKSVIA